MFIYLDNKNYILKFGNLLSKILFLNIICCLIGGMGAGKTTLSKGLIFKSFEQKKKIKSPTYNLIETYICERNVIHHLDFYRLNHINNLIEIDIINYITNKSIVIIEWGDKFFCMINYNSYIYIFYYSNFLNRLLFINFNFINFKKLLH